MPLPAAILPKLAKLVLLLSSDKLGEVAAAAAAIDRTLESAGATWHELAAQLTEQRVSYRDPPRTDPARATWGDLLGIASELDGNPDLSPWESDFVSGVRRALRRGYPLSAKQLSILDRIWARISGSEAA